MFSAGTVLIFDDINIISAVLCTSLKLSVPAKFNASAGENMLAIHGENVQLILLYIGGGDRLENVIQAVTVWGESVGNGKQRAARMLISINTWRIGNFVVCRVVELALVVVLVVAFAFACLCWVITIVVIAVGSFFTGFLVGDGIVLGNWGLRCRGGDDIVVVVCRNHCFDSVSAALNGGVNSSFWGGIGRGACLVC